MALTDPQSVTINAVPNTLARVGSGVNVGSFSKDDGNVKLSVMHTYGKRTRRSIRLEHSKIAPDPLISSTNIKFGMSVIMTIDEPVTGYSLAEKKQIADALVAWATASTGANLTKVLGGES